MTLKSIIPGLCLVFLISPVLRADELEALQARNAQLEATVEELTLQLAEALRERRRLEAELARVRADAKPVAAAVPVAPAADDTLPAGDRSAADPAPAAIPAEAPADPAPEVQMREVAVASATAVEAPEPVAAARTGVDGCDVTEALAGYDGKRAGNERLSNWLKASDNLERCTTAQLRELRDAVKWDWLGYQKEPLGLIDAELARR